MLSTGFNKQDILILTDIDPVTMYERQFLEIQIASLKGQLNDLTGAPNKRIRGELMSVKIDNLSHS